jgi:Glyoxalase-like domain
MTLRVGSVVINCADIQSMTQFWASALDLIPGPISPEGDFRVLGGNSAVHISLQVAKTPVTARDQMHLDLFTHEQAAEVHRLLGLGASYVRHNEDPDDDFVVLRDPEGNYLCVCALPADVRPSTSEADQSVNPATSDSNQATLATSETDESVGPATGDTDQPVGSRTTDTDQPVAPATSDTALPGTGRDANQPTGEVPD